MNEFTDAEWPQQSPANFNHMDIGEEQSNSHVTSIAWSPPGLALHQRSVLAVLTANNILSLWSSQSNTKDQASWKRVLVINNALKAHRARIRCMAWSAATIQRADDHDLQQRPQWVPFMLAIAYDGDPAVRVLGISSPQLGSDCTNWTVVELACFSTPSCEQNNQVFSLFDQELEKATFVDYVGFGPTKIDGSTSETIISYRFRGVFTHGILHTSRITPYQSSIQTVGQRQVLYPRYDDYLSYPVLWLNDNVSFLSF